MSTENSSFPYLFMHRVSPALRWANYWSFIWDNCISYSFWIKWWLFIVSITYCNWMLWIKTLSDSNRLHCNLIQFVERILCQHFNISEFIIIIIFLLIMILNIWFLYYFLTIKIIFRMHCYTCTFIEIWKHHTFVIKKCSFKILLSLMSGHHWILRAFY